MNKREYFDGLAERWDAMPAPPDAEERVRAFLGAALPPGARRVLDAGCGTGLLARPLLAERASIMQLVEMDFAEAMLRAARAKNGTNKTAYVCSDAQRPCFAPSSFDAVLCFGLVPHLPDAREALRRLIEVLKPGGRIAIGHMMGSVQLNALHGSIGGAVGDDRLPEAGEMARLLAQLGARAVRATEDERHYAVVAEKD